MATIAACSKLVKSEIPRLDADLSQYIESESNNIRVKAKLRTLK
jgi:hypothetical protein